MERSAQALEKVMNEKILLAEDDDVLREIIRTLLEIDGYQVTTTANGRLALASFSEKMPDLIVSDIMMPEMDGFSLLEAVRGRPEGATVPFLFLSARHERTDLSQARRLGADDFLFKPFDSTELLGAVKAKLERRRIVQLFDTREAHLQTLMVLANVIEARDPQTRGHVERVQYNAMALGRALGWSLEDLTFLEFGAILHDVGKIVVPRAILNKQGSLDPEELQVMRQHAEAGAAMLNGVDHLRPVIPYALCHHERWDGNGYPRGLTGEDIPKEGRLLAIVDVYDAMISDRPYRAGMDKEMVLDELRKGAGTHFDPQMVEVFLRLVS
jgi:putative two-component system response regulator